MKTNLNFDPVYMPENNDDATMSCEICSERLASPENQIVFCELCNVGVHQFCYGFPLSNEIPEGDWYCNRCKFCVENGIEPEKIKCVLCSYSMGSMKKIKHNKWVHIICVNWIPEIYFENFFEKNTLSFMDQANFKKRKHKMCYLCGSREGYCISCEFSCKKVKCQRFYHVYCARKNKVIFSERLMSIYLFDMNNKYIKTFCLEHLRKEFMKNKEFGLEEGLQKEKDDKIQKEIIKNRTNLDDTQIKPEIYQDFEEEEFKFQYEQIVSFLLGKKEKKSKILPQTANNINVVNINGKKFKSRNKAKKKLKSDPSPTPPSFLRQPTQISCDPQSESENNNNSMNYIEEAISETELSEQDHPKQPPNFNHQNYTKLNRYASKHHELNSIKSMQEDNMSAKNCKNDKFHDLDNKNGQNDVKQYKINFNIAQKHHNVHKSPPQKDFIPKQQQENNSIIMEIDQYQENFENKVKVNGFLEESGIFETVEVDVGNELQIGEDSPQYENRHNDKNNDLISIGSSDSEIDESINNQINEFDDDFYYQKDFYKRFEAVDRLQRGKILSVETLKENQTFQSFFDNQHYYNSKIEYLDNPFYPKPLDKIQINELEILDFWNEKFDLGSISRKLLGFMRKKTEEDREKFKNNEKKMEKKTKDLKFITKISEEFEFKNTFDFEGIPYLHSDK